MSNTSQILERIKGIRQFQPSAIRNSIAMWFLQLLSFIGAVGCIIGGIAILVQSIQQNQQMQNEQAILVCLLLSIALLLFLVLKLTKMVRRRNAYILELNEVFDEEEDKIRKSMKVKSELN